MKTLIYLFAIAMFLFAGCAKDEMFDENSNNLELKKAKVPIPMKAEFCMNPNMGAGFILIEGLNPHDLQSYLPKEGWVSGHDTHGRDNYGRKSDHICLCSSNANGCQNDIRRKNYSGKW
jgi:hypothetical protein